MKSRHAAAVALVGWYLMMPPVRWDRWDLNLPFDVSALLSRWTMLYSYASYSECQHAADEFSHEPDDESVINLEKLKYLCVSDNDPRSKEIRTPTH